VGHGEGWWCLRRKTLWHRPLARTRHRNRNLRHLRYWNHDTCLYVCGCLCVRVHVCMCVCVYVCACLCIQVKERFPWQREHCRHGEEKVEEEVEEKKYHLWVCGCVDAFDVPAIIAPACIHACKVIARSAVQCSQKHAFPGTRACPYFTCGTRCGCQNTLMSQYARMHSLSRVIWGCRWVSAGGLEVSEGVG
jgi:hypothetical protein